MKEEQSQFLFLGDSTTYGYPYTNQKSWVWYISSYFINKKCVNLGVNGADIIDIYHNFNSYIQTHSGENISDVFIMSGLNEVFHDITLQQVDQALLDIFELCQQNHFHLYCGLSIAVFGEELDEGESKKWRSIRERISCWADVNHIPKIDFNILSTAEDYSDFLHPSLVGYEKMAECFLFNWKNNCRTF